MVVLFRISTLLCTTVVLFLFIVNCIKFSDGLEESEWCRYKFYTDPRNWLDAKAICELENKTLAHITNQVQHDFLTSFIKTDLPSMYSAPPSSMWLGLYKMQQGSPIWQDNCQYLDTSTYDPGIKANFEEWCYLLGDLGYQSDYCDATKPFLCQAETVDTNTCYEIATGASHAMIQATPHYPVASPPTGCYPLCMSCCCIGFQHDYGNGLCNLIRYHAYSDIGQTTIYTKAILQRQYVMSTLNTARNMEELCPTPILPSIPLTTAPDPIPTSSFIQQMMQSTQVHLTSSEIVIFSRTQDNVEYVPLEAALNNLYNDVNKTTDGNTAQLAGFSETLRQLVKDRPGEVCSSLETIIEIINKITDGMEPYHREENAMKTIFRSHLEVVDQVFGFQQYTGCQQSAKSITNLIELEDVLVGSAKLFLGMDYSNRTFNTNGISVLLIVEDGGELKGQYPTTYGRVIALYPDVSRRALAKQKVLSMVISYKKNPFFTGNSKPINLPVITTGVYSEDGMPLSDFHFKMAFPVTSEYDVRNNMIDMIRNGTHFKAAFPGGLFNSSSVIIFIDVSLMKSCRIYGKYGTSSPTNQDFDFYLYTHGLFSVKEYRPYEFTFSYRNGTVQIPIYITPVVFIAQCQERRQRRRKRSLGSSNRTNGGIVPTIGVVQVSSQVIDRQADEWQSNNDVKLVAGELSEITLQSYFFGAFSANVELFAPDQIDFETVFVNFSEKLADTPYVLGTILAVVVVLLLVTPILHRRDVIDSALWSYQHLVDNKAIYPFYYYICVSTGVRSQRRMECPVYINIIGTTAETGPRLLTSNTRNNFANGTSSHFCLTSDTCLGNILNVKIWLGDTVQSPSWYLKRLVILDGQTTNVVQLKCNNWLSLKKDTGQTWRTLRVDRDRDKKNSIGEVSANNIFDDHLWISLIFRPRFSRFTRVQRLWSIVSLLFISMVASAMFYDTPDATNPLINIAGFEIGFKEIYNGFMSSVITVVPCVLMTSIFKNRKRRGEGNMTILYDGNTRRLSGTLPWWTIFLAYIILFICIICGSFFTFLYSLEWAPSLTLKWMTSFFLGITGSVVCIEPMKAIILAVAMVFICSSKAHQKDYVIPPTSLKLNNQDLCCIGRPPLNYPDCPGDQQETLVQRQRRYMLRMDRKLNRFLKKLIMGLMYVVMLLVICTQQKVNDVFGQNSHLKKILKSSEEMRTKDDVWQYVKTVVVNRLSPTEFYNGDVKPYSELRYIGANYRMGPIRLRQTRVSGNCNAPSLMKAQGITCIPDFDKDSEDKGTYMEGWATAKSSTDEETGTSPYRYQYDSDKETPPHIGHFGTYGGGGYLVDLDFEPSKAINIVNELQKNVWLDERTRVLFIEACLVNRNNMLFSLIQIVLEFPGVGGTFTEYSVVSANLYPYRDVSDFVVLAVQFVFVITILVRIVLFIVKVVRTRARSLITIRQLVDLFDLVISVAVIVYLVLKLTNTIAILNTLRHEIGFYSSFGYIFQWDEYLSVLLGIATCIAILDLLQHLSFNYHFYLMYRTIMAFGPELFQFSTLLILLMIGFSCFIYLMYGHMEGSFKTVTTGILTLFRMTIGMIKFRSDLELDLLGIAIILSLYALVVTLVYINMFTSALNFGITNIKSLIAEGKTSFDVHLNQHLWDRLTYLLSLCRPSRRFIPTETLEETKQTEPIQKLNLQQGERTVERFLSKISEQLAHDVQQEKVFFKRTLLPSRHFVGQNFIWSSRRETPHGVQYRYSNDWVKRDNSFVLEFLDEKLDCRIDVECIQDNVAFQRGLITYGRSTYPISPLFIVNTQENRIQSCKVMVKVESSQLSAQPVFLIIGTGDPTHWGQYTTQEIAADGTNVYLSVLVPRCPRYITAVRSDLWCGIKYEIQQLNQFVLTSKKKIIQPGSAKNMLLSFAENAVISDTIIKTVMEQGDPFPTLHILASEKVSGPIIVEYVGKERTDRLSIESFMELQTLTKTGDLEWKQESTSLEQHGNIVELNSLEAGVKVAITVSLSDYKILFANASSRHLEHERETLMNIYKGLIPTKHWRQIGKSVEISGNQLDRLENVKPRSLEEKTCLVLGHWLKKNRGRSLGEIKHIWEAI